ncbi:hypothetical protein NKH89_15050 [Mesorhizobium sp. M0923]|uniref:hypothetical protein n=1 Tax=unclassified Mesorhizobium TaxID=325217 RepID=UPI0033386210
MSDNETAAPAPTSHRGTAVVIVNLAAWLIAALLQYLVPERVSTAIAGAAVLSGAIGGALASTNSLKNASLTGFAGVASTILILSLYVPFTGFRIGVAVGGIGTAFDAIVAFTSFYALMFLLIFAIEYAASLFGRK